MSKIEVKSSEKQKSVRLNLKSPTKKTRKKKMHSSYISTLMNKVFNSKSLEIMTKMHIDQKSLIYNEKRSTAICSYQLF